MPARLAIILAFGLAFGLTRCGDPSALAPTPASITISPERAELDGPGDTVPFEARVIGSDGAPMADVSVEWGSSDPSVVTIAGDGSAGAISEGKATITARVEEVSGTAEAEVLPPIIETVTIRPEVARFDGAGDEIRLDAEAVGRRGQTINDPELVWSSTDPAVVTVDEEGLATAVAVGQARVIATARQDVADTAEAAVHALLDVAISGEIENGRFLTVETVSLRADTDRPVDPETIWWFSDRDGRIGTGFELEESGLSTGAHRITADGPGGDATFRVRIVDGLQELFESEPAAGERERIDQEFEIIYRDGEGPNHKWSEYLGKEFDITNREPSPWIIYNRLEVLRRQRYDRANPYGVESFYDYLTTHVDRIELRLDCGNHLGGGGLISLNRLASHWYDIIRPYEGDNCTNPSSEQGEEITAYTGDLGLLMHEARHSDPADPGHIDCNGDGRFAEDPYFEEGGGYAWGALYSMWGYEYSTLADDSSRTAYRRAAAAQLERFCPPEPRHSDPHIQGLIDEILSG